MVSLYDEGYIIKKDEGKTVFLDNNIKEVTSGYDYIVPDFDEYHNMTMLVGIDIVENGKLEKTLISLEGNILTNKTYEYVKLTDYIIEKNRICSYTNGRKWI